MMVYDTGYRDADRCSLLHVGTALQKQQLSPPKLQHPGAFLITGLPGMIVADLPHEKAGGENQQNYKAQCIYIYMNDGQNHRRPL